MKKVATYAAFALVLTTVLAADPRPPRTNKPAETPVPQVPQAPEQCDPSDPESMRQLMVSWASTMEAVLGHGPGASQAFERMTGPLVQAWYDQIPDPERLATLLSRDINATLMMTTPPQVAAAQGVLFSPDYPPGTGPYQMWVLNETAGLASQPQNRCDTPAWADKYATWVVLKSVLDGAEIACVIGGCDPTGVGCAIACAIIEGARIAEKIARIPLDACEVHDSNVDAAEIEATYENTLVIASDIENARGEIITNSNLNRDSIVVNDNVNRDAIIANDNANRDVTLGLFEDALQREMMNDLSVGRCEHWMYTPMYADETQTVMLGGYLERTVELLQTIIDQGQMLGSETARLVTAQVELDAVLPLSQERPLEAELICRHLEKAYKSARMLPLRAAQ